MTWSRPASPSSVGVDDRVGEGLRDGQPDLVEPLAGSAGGGRDRGQRAPSQRHRLRNSRIGLVQSFATAHLDSFEYPDELEVIRRNSQAFGREASSAR